VSPQPRKPTKSTALWHQKTVAVISGVPRNFSGGGGGGVKKNKVSTQGPQPGGVGVVAPSSGVPLNLQSGSTFSSFRDVEGCYGCIFHGTVNSAQLCQNFGISVGRGFEHPEPLPPRYATGCDPPYCWRCFEFLCSVRRCMSPRNAYFYVLKCSVMN
jgi:hypothetical protein